MQQIPLSRPFILYLILILFIWGYVTFSSMPLKLIVLSSKKANTQIFVTTISWFLLLLITIFFYQNIAKICKVIRTLLVVADLLFKRPHCPPWDPKKIDKKGGILLRASNFRKKFIPGIFLLTKENISKQCRISVSHAVC